MRLQFEEIRRQAEEALSQFLWVEHPCHLRMRDRHPDPERIKLGQQLLPGLTQLPMDLSRIRQRLWRRDFRQP